MAPILAVQSDAANASATLGPIAMSAGWIAGNPQSITTDTALVGVSPGIHPVGPQEMRAITRRYGTIAMASSLRIFLLEAFPPANQRIIAAGGD